MNSAAGAGAGAETVVATAPVDTVAATAPVETASCTGLPDTTVVVFVMAPVSSPMRPRQQPKTRRPNMAASKHAAAARFKRERVLVTARMRGV